MLRLVLALILLTVTTGIWPASAHLTPNSEVKLDFGASEVRADVIIPIGDYAAASGNPVDGSPGSLELAADYLRRTVRVTAPSGKRWTIAMGRVEFVQIAGPPDLHATLTLSPPVGASARELLIDWRAVVDAVPGHFVLFVARSDFSAGAVAEQRQILGAVRAERPRLAIDRGASNALRGFGAALALGVEHIAAGHDHLLFLITLLVPAPLMANSGRWTTPLAPRRALWRLFGIVTAFTIGHSLTLLGGVLLGWHLPERGVEIAIAASILISATHAWRPLFPGREAWIAGGFGLVHGLAFATLANGFGLGVTERVLATIGFNLGVEIFQLIVVAAVMPLLFLLAARPSYRAIRVAFAGFAGLAASGWMAERITGTNNSVAVATDALLSQAGWLVAFATVGAVTVGLRSRAADRQSP